MAQSETAMSALVLRMTRRIVETVDPERIILCGSRADQTAERDSDIDLLVVERKAFGPSRSRRKELTRLLAALREFAVAKDLLLYSQEEFERWRNSRNHVIAHAVREGRVLYERK